MANKKTESRADRAVNDAKKTAAPKAAAKKPAAKKKPPVRTPMTERLPGNALAALISLGLFVLFLVIAINPEGALLMVIQDVLLGLVGKAGFYFLIPALLFIFALNTFARHTNVLMRSANALGAVFLCGAIFHLAVERHIVNVGMALIGDLYLGGARGITGGVLCGGFAMVLRYLCGNVISYLLCGLGVIVCLLNAMQLTIPSIIRAIAERPRDDWEDEDEDQQEYIEPAAKVVNHIANKQIEHKRQQRAKLAAQREQQRHELPAPEPQPAAEAAEPGKPSRRGAEMLSQIEMDINAPLIPGCESQKEEPKPEPVPGEIPVEPRSVSRMPELDLEEPIVPQKKPKAQPEKDSKPAGKKPDKVTSQDAAESAELVAREIAEGEAEEKPEYCFPPIDLLKRPVRGTADGTDEMRENSLRLNEALASFKIDAHIINVTRGPSVTRYEVELDKGVRLSKLTGCADDIALSLGASGVRIAAVTGKISVVGIEVPNRAVNTVSLREVIDSPAFSNARSKSSFAVGKDIGGSCIVGNIAKMPHMLIAGTTGSGKSVCMNSIIISLLYKASPEDVKLIMVDPKMVELGIYNSIPHLLIPVVTDPKKAAGSLQWAVTEMLRRYKLMSDAGVRDLESYNSVITADGGQKMPQVVIIIDELADLMLVAAKEVEDSICRIAQMGRASGMHLIIATQRPSADVITGLMKANIPSRIAFSVASAMESRIILDTQGAEKLVGKGDMLYAPIGSGKPLRVQGCFVTDTEVEAVASYVKENYVSDYNQQVLEEIERKAQQTGKSKSAASDPEPSEEELEGDELLPAAVEVILETGQASVSMLQRRLKLGYARAARIVDEMEEKGYVGPFQGSKPRSILITKEKWEAMQDGAQMSFDEPEDEISE